MSQVSPDVIHCAIMIPAVQCCDEKNNLTKYQIYSGLENVSITEYQIYSLSQDKWSLRVMSQVSPDVIHCAIIILASSVVTKRKILPNTENIQV